MNSLNALMLDTPIAVGLQVLTINLNGVALLLVIVGIGAWIGWTRGARAIFTVALVSVIAYLVCVQGGQFVVDTVNRFYQNGPRLGAFAIGRDPSTVPVLDPLIQPGFTIPLFFRFVLFVALVLFGWFFRKRPAWYGAQPSKGEPLARTLGGFIGGFTALIWTAAAISFWVDLLNSGGGFGGPIANVLSVLPDIRIFIPAMITIFFLLIIVIVLFSLPKLAATKA